MQVEQLLATEPTDRRYADMIGDAFASAAPNRLRAAIAYATQSGVAEICAVLGDVAGWRDARKQWLVGIDFCRSDPQALAHLAELAHSTVRVHDGAFVSGRSGCAPRVSYHPKMYVFSGPDDCATVVGSGNLSQTGLRLGVEAGVSISSNNIADFDPLLRWYKKMWRGATPLGDIEAAYARQYAAHENRRQPAPVEDDAAPASAGRRGQLTPAQLRQLRVCEHLWIEAGNLHENRGPDRPGNQLMLKRNTRVFFGFQAEELEPDTLVGSVTIGHEGHERRDCSLRFSNNSMDVLTLPIPGDEGPEAYDQEVLLFCRSGVRRFDLELGSRANAVSWRKQSERIDGAFQMTSGRRWGIF